MHDIIDDCAKRRLTDRMEILMAVNILRSRGFEEDELVMEMTKLFYVDLDEFNFVLDATEQVRPDRAGFLQAISLQRQAIAA